MFELENKSTSLFKNRDVFGISVYHDKLPNNMNTLSYLTNIRFLQRHKCENLLLFLKLYNYTLLYNRQALDGFWLF